MWTQSRREMADVNVSIAVAAKNNTARRPTPLKKDRMTGVLKPS